MAIGMAVPRPYLRNVGRTAVVSSMQGWHKVNFIDEFSTAFPVPCSWSRTPAPAPSPITSSTLRHHRRTSPTISSAKASASASSTTATSSTASSERPPEIGHISIDINGRPCDRGNVGCLERYCSTPAIHKTLIPMAADRSPMRGTMTHPQACRALFAKAGDGDEAAIAIVREVARYVGYGCVTIFNGYNPEHIIIGDIVSEAGPILLDEVRATVAERAIPEINASTSISLSTLSADAAVSGAAAVAVTQFLEHPSVFFDVS